MLLVILFSILLILMTTAIIIDCYDYYYNNHTMLKDKDEMQQYLVKYHKFRGKRLTLWNLFIHNMKVILLN